MSDAPTSYKDPYYIGLAQNTENKLGLPSGLLQAVVSRGERSNSDQVSEAGARTVFQITPSTRKLAVDKWGVDPYLSSENAAEVAGLLLKDSLARNNDNPKLAVAEYHGGTDRSNWGPKTTAYVGRVFGSPLPGTEGEQPTQKEQKSTYDQVSDQFAARQNAQDPMSGVFEAYKNGDLSPEGRQSLEADVKAGKVMLPKGMSLNDASVASSDKSISIPDKFFSDYQSGLMPREQRIQLEKDAEKGLIKVPEGIQLGKTEPLGVTGSIKEMYTGEERSTPTSRGLKDWYDMPEMRGIYGKVGGLGTALANAGPEEAVKILQANIPGISVRKDEKGNVILKSPSDGQEYSIKPGFQMGDIPRTAQQLASFIPSAALAVGTDGASLPVMAAISAGSTALNQAAIEGHQAAYGGSFDPAQVAIAGALGGATPLATKALSGISGGVSRVLGIGAREAPPEAPLTQLARRIETQPAEDTSLVSTTPQIAPTPMSLTEAATTAKKAATGFLGTDTAAKKLAEEAAPDAERLAAAHRLGLSDTLQPDQLTTKQPIIELYQVAKSVPGSPLREQELEALDKARTIADDLITKFSGTHDLSTLSSDVKDKLQSTRDAFKQTENTYYDDLRSGIKAKTPAPATNVLSYIKDQADQLGGIQNVSAEERMIWNKLRPKEEAQAASNASSISAPSQNVLSFLSKKAEKLGGAQNLTSDEQAALSFLSDKKGASTASVGVSSSSVPTYALLDDVRKDIGAASRNQGPFKDADSRRLGILYDKLLEDQKAVAEQHGLLDTFNAARATTVMRKKVEENLQDLFGRELDRNFVTPYITSIKKLPVGDTSGFIRLLKAVPDDMRQSVVATGLKTAFGESANKGQMSFPAYATWFEKLQDNKQAFSAIMSNLPKGAAQDLSDLAQVARGIANASKERVTTGRLSAGLDALRGADTLAARMYDFARKVVPGAATEFGTSAVGMPGAGITSGIVSALSKGKTDAVKAVSEFLASPEFKKVLHDSQTQTTKESATRIAVSKPFTKVWRVLKQPRELSTKERFVLAALQAHKDDTKKKEKR